MFGMRKRIRLRQAQLQNGHARRRRTQPAAEAAHLGAAAPHLAPDLAHLAADVAPEIRWHR